MPAFLIAHTSLSGANAAQATVPAKTETAARTKFHKQYPDRVIQVVGQREGRAPTRRERRWR